MLPNIKVKNLIKKHTELEKELSSGEIDKKNFAEKSKEYSELNEIINEAKEYILFEKNKLDLEKIINDANSEKEIKDLAELELNDLIKNNINNENKIKLFLLPKDEADTKNAIIEIRAGTGGDEAALFSMVLMKMYQKYAEIKKWKFEIMSFSDTNIGLIQPSQEYFRIN